ncbi:hypothetical protein I7I51_05636 [Histoplasma capsulatum]|uniref:Uncharacterized protein n=2 Tax=Histoplasma TaxID=5036 RepID=A0A8A1M8M8_AJECA|nr:hypothetical protein I7I51_05636 [Histoplasma capsulatum]
MGPARCKSKIWGREENSSRRWLIGLGSLGAGCWLLAAGWDWGEQGRVAGSCGGRHKARTGQVWVGVPRNKSSGKPGGGAGKQGGLEQEDAGGRVLGQWVKLHSVLTGLTEGGKSTKNRFVR